MITYRQAARDELELAVEWAAAEGWNPGIGDADAFWETDPDGFVCAEEDGEVVATGSIVSYGGRFGFMGFFIVRPELRGRGIGREFWHWRRDTLRARLLPGATIGMDGVLPMQDFYARGGFQLAHLSMRMAGVGQAAEPDATLAELSSLPFESVAECDLRHFGFPRERFLRRWIRPARGLALAATSGASVTGMGVVRACRDGYKIGPLFASSPEVAERLFTALSAHAVGDPVFLDVPECNTDAVALAARHHLTADFGCARMYYGPAPSLPWHDIYGVTTFELG